MKTIKYIAFYDTLNLNNENRQANLAAINKIKYICSAITRNGYNVEIISPSWTNNIKGFYKGKKVNIDDNITLINFATFGTRFKILRKFKYLFSLFQFTLYLLLHTSKNEKVIVYHSVILSLPLRILKKIKKFTLILEIEEIYGEVWGVKKDVSLEMKIFQKSDKYLLVSDLLEERLKKILKGKERTILYGGYSVNTNKVKTFSRPTIIQLVYAGSLNATKGGALNAVLSMQHLDENYKLNILGHGPSSNIKSLKEEINQINEVKGYKAIEWHGTLHGEQYTEFLLNCHIGINPQIQGEYMDTAFPSKVLSYLSHDLRVVSTRIKSIAKSEISHLIDMVDSDSPEKIAEAVMLVDLKKPHNSSGIISSLDKKFVNSINKMLSE